MKSKRYLLVDFGGVFIKYSFTKALAYWSKACCVNVSTLQNRWKIDEKFDRFEAGEIEPIAYFEHLRQMLRIQISDDKLIEGWNSIYMGIRLDLLELLSDLKANDWRVFGISNTNVLHQSYWTSLYQREISIFENIYTSCDIGICKPKLEFFKHILINECLASFDDFIVVDDMVRVIEECNSNGIQAVLFKSTEQLRLELTRFGCCCRISREASAVEKNGCL